MRLILFTLRFYILLVSMLIYCTASGQQPDTVMTPAVDTVVTESKKKGKGLIKNLLQKNDYPNPTKAVVYSLLLPGAGQFYNKKYWKIPIVYGALGGLYFGIQFQDDRYDRFNTAFELRRAGETHEFSNTALDSDAALLRRRNGFRKNRELVTILFVITYLLNGMDAYVDAQLLDFDVSEDLSINLEPMLDHNYGMGSTTGLSLKISFGK